MTSTQFMVDWHIEIDCRTSVFEGFAHELQNPNNQEQSFALIKRKAVGEALFTAGANPEIPPKNRAALYDASSLFQNSKSSKKRQRGLCDHPAEPCQHEAVLDHGNRVFSTAADRPADLDSDAPALSKSKKKARTHAGEDIRRRPSEQTATENQPSSKPSTTVRAQDGSPPGGKAGKKFKLVRASRNGQNTTDRSSKTNTQDIPSRFSGKEGVALSPKSVKALTGAVKKVKEMKSKKRISFDLKKNVVWSMNQPLPPAEIRTPPSAKPNGSALKKTSSVGKAKAARRLSF